MNLNEKFPVSPQKVEELMLRIRRLQIDMSQVEEQFTRGSGHGGQKLNKTSSCVVLRYPALNLDVRNQESRQRSLNRFLALRELVDRIEMDISPRTSQRLKEIQRLRKQKARRQRRSASLPSSDTKNGIL
ncbi:MAG: peptide chain release factor-like protein [Elusimicrobia bacterium]|nr:peptide chain release factor-like protein [Elusimicrobiota bacterium]MBI2915720.1 peptide chain release factor-like protein [Elusimicrobiota bacterium]